MNRLKELRNIKGLTQVELAKEIGVKDSAISKYENGQLEISNELLIKLADYFNVSTDYILGRTDDPAPAPDVIQDLSTNNSYHDNEIVRIGHSNFAKRLKSLRAEKGLTQKELVEATNISSFSMASNYENGIKSIPDIFTIENLATFFDVTVDYLIGRSDYRDSNMGKSSSTQQITIADWPSFLAQLPEDQAMLFENTDYPDEEKIAIMEEAEKAKQKKLKKIKRFEEFTDDIIDEAYRFAKYQDAQRKRMDDEN